MGVVLRLPRRRVISVAVAHRHPERDRHALSRRARDVGKALGFEETSMDRLSKLLPHYGDIGAEALEQAEAAANRGGRC